MPGRLHWSTQFAKKDLKLEFHQLRAVDFKNIVDLTGILLFVYLYKEFFIELMQHNVRLLQMR